MPEEKTLDSGPESASKYLRVKVLPRLFGRSCVQCVEACTDDGTRNSWPARLSRVATLARNGTLDPKLNPYASDVIGRFSSAMSQHHPSRLTSLLSRQFAHQLLLGIDVLSNFGVAKDCPICNKATWVFAGRIASKARLISTFDTTGLQLPRFSDVEWGSDVKEALEEFDSRVGVSSYKA
jgi:hypothetical protein